ncbi:MAG: hypothetical protein QM741_12050 [Rudaea sp.]|uniref:hypothetical protein n=1 Tax=Rudaea sp. TaxID=2136325 RepID=UPI0039E3747A
MNFSDPTYLILALALALPMAILAVLNGLLRERGGFLRGWAGAIFVGLCWMAALGFIVRRLAE